MYDQLKHALLFNRQRLCSHRDRVTSDISNHPLFKYAADDIIERLRALDKRFTNILDIGCRNGYLSLALLREYNPTTIIATDISQEMIKQAECTVKLLVDEEELEFAENTFDLITFSLGLHWVNNVPQLLKNIHYWLNPSGVFIANFIGGRSLQNLRYSLIQAEMESKSTYSQHISPFIQFDHTAYLLQQAAFHDIIVDYEPVHLEYKNAFELMKAIKITGESNALHNMSNYGISKTMLAILKKETELFCDKLNVISLIASKNTNVIHHKT